MLSAKHCWVNHVDGWQCVGGAGTVELDVTTLPQVSINFAVDRDSGSVPPGGAVHTLKTSGPVLTRNDGGSIDLCGNDGAATDLALIQLDSRVPVSTIRPLHPPMTATGDVDTSLECYYQVHDADSFNAWVVGYGRVGWWDSVSYRNYPWQDEYDYEAQQPGDFVIRNNWSPGLNYSGSLQGDSGGALVTARADGAMMLCGINSRFYPTATGVSSAAADVASINNIAFLKAAHVVDAAGNFMGECNSGPLERRDIDSDDDLIPDACDPCPTTPDLGYRKTGIIQNFGPDTDGDGVADGCDSCPASLCQSRGGVALDCYNPPAIDADGKFLPQPDIDGDGVGDSCDLRPGVRDEPKEFGTLHVDDDNDGVGNACDNYNRFNPTIACQTNASTGPIALSDDRLVWLGEHGPNVADGAYDAVEIYSSPVPDKPSDVVITKGPPLPVTAGLLDIKTGGDYAATGGCYKLDGSFECRVFVVQLSTGKLWRMRPRMPGYYSNPVLGVSNDEIVLGETDNTNAGVGNRIRRLVRYKTATLDAWADLM